MNDSDGKIIIKTEIDTSDFVELKAKLNLIDKQYNSLEKQLQKKNLTSEKETEILKKQNELIEKRKLLTSEIEKFEQTENIENVGKSFKSILGSVGKIGIKIAGFSLIFASLTAGVGLFGIAFQKAFETEQIKANLDYIKFAISKALEPAANKIAEIISKIIHMLYVALQYIGYIIKAWTGVNIFENAGVDAYANSLKKAEKNAKDLNKQLAGFDKINKLDDKSTSGGGASGGAMPDFDLSKMEDVKIPKWIQWIADNKDLVIAAILAIAAAFVTLQLGFGGIVALIVAAIVALVALIIKNWDKIKEVLGTVGSWIYEHIIKPVGDFFVALWERIKGIFGPVIDFFVNIFTTIWGNIYTFISNIIQIVGFVWNKIIGILSPIATWIYNNVIRPVVNFFANAWNFILDKINRVIGVAKNIGITIGNVIGNAFKKIINAVLGAIENILNKPIGALNGLIGAINNIPGLNLGKLQTFKLPRLAAGGIVNMPGRGIDYYGANIGERGREGIVPLDNKQSLETIGRTIAKYANFSADITLELESRILARVMKEINSDKRFARNGG